MMSTKKHGFQLQKLFRQNLICKYVKYNRQMEGAGLQSIQLPFIS